MGDNDPMPPARVLHVNVVHEITANPHGEGGRSAIDKRPVDGRVTVGSLGVAGDTQLEVEHHGGPDQAVYAYAAEDARWWSEQLGREVPPGLFGENLTLEGVDVTGSVIGERWRIGAGEDATVVEVTMPRTPCATFQHRMQEPHWVKRFTQHGAPGAYLRVVQQGTVAAGDPVEVVHRPDHGVRIRDVFPRAEPATMQRLLDAADAGLFDLAAKMRLHAEKTAARATARG